MQIWKGGPTLPLFWAWLVPKSVSSEGTALWLCILSSSPSMPSRPFGDRGHRRRHCLCRQRIGLCLSCLCLWPHRMLLCASQHLGLPDTTLDRHRIHHSPVVSSVSAACLPRLLWSLSIPVCPCSIKRTPALTHSSFILTLVVLVETREEKYDFWLVNFSSDVYYIFPPSNFFWKVTYFQLCVYEWLPCVSVYLIAWRGQKKALVSLEMSLSGPMNPHMGARNHIRVQCKSSKCS